MTLFALVLILAAAVFHATWNLLAKRVGDGVLSSSGSSVSARSCSMRRSRSSSCW
jgi:hypothetical protein